MWVASVALVQGLILDIDLHVEVVVDDLSLGGPVLGVQDGLVLGDHVLGTELVGLRVFPTGVHVHGGRSPPLVFVLQTVLLVLVGVHVLLECEWIPLRVGSFQ